MSCAKIAEPIEMPFGLWNQIGPRKHVLGAVRTGATRQIPLNRPCAEVMQPFVKLLWPHVSFIAVAELSYKQTLENNQWTNGSNPTLLMEVWRIMLHRKQTNVASAYPSWAASSQGSRHSTGTDEVMQFVTSTQSTYYSSWNLPHGTSIISHIKAAVNTRCR